MTSASRLSMIGNAILLAALLVFAHGLLKWVAQHPEPSYFSLLFNYWPAIIVSLGVYFFIFFYYAHLLKKHSISRLYPIYTGLSIVFLLLAGALVFHENITIMQVGGCISIIVGIFLVGK